MRWLSLGSVGFLARPFVVIRSKWKGYAALVPDGQIHSFKGWGKMSDLGFTDQVHFELAPEIECCLRILGKEYQT